MLTKIKILLVYTIFFVSLSITVNAKPPQNYIANVEIKEGRDKIMEIFVKIDAQTKIGNEIPKETFSTLNTNFNKVFKYFPQNYKFKVIYEQCLATSKKLSEGYNYGKLNNFMDNCYKPFQGIIKTINSKYTIIAKGKANPTSGPAPLTVTFNGTNSIDPSNETIPENNYFRYYRDIDGNDKTIGIGPIVKHTFEKPGNYIIHLTVRSSNKINGGIFDGEDTFSITVAPKSAIINVYLNGKKMNKNKATKIGTQEAEKGLIIDGSSTIPIGGREILSYKFDIKGNNGFNFTKQGEGKPGVITVPIPNKGQYSLMLSTKDNEGNTISEKYKIIISDPVAVIKQQPEEGNTSTKFSFDATASYSIISNIKLYTREIFNQNGDKINTYQGKTIQQQFIKPGTYTVKLTVEDEYGKNDIITKQIIVDSTDPIAQFSIEPKYNLLYPSEYILDASLSSDNDVLNGFDKLQFNRNLDKGSEIKNKDNENKKILVVFNTKGEHKIKLSVKDNYGKISEITKTLKVESTIRPKLLVSPKATIWGKEIKFIAQSNKKIINYERDFGDGETIKNTTNIVKHTYKKIGNYKVSLTVFDSKGETNTVKEDVFIGEKNSPILVYKIIGKNSNILTQNETCPEILKNGKTINHKSYGIERYEKISFDTTESLNSKGEKSDINFYFQPKNDEIFQNNNFSYKFDELGCKYVDITIEDAKLGKTQKERIWFKIKNALPKLDNILLFFPQYGNEMKVGFQENNIKDIFTTKYDPLMVKVFAQNTIDPDGYISYFKRYYYYKDNPLRILEMKITPGDIPYAFFSLPRMPGEFMFGVTMYDSDGGKIKSENIIGNGPIVFFPPDVKKPDIPIVTVKTDKLNTEVGDTVTFDAISKVISDAPDFKNERTIQYDFDGDGERDLITKKDHVKHIYTKANERGYTPRIAVLYRGYKGIGKGASIVVKKGLKPRLLFDIFDKYVIFRDISLGEIKKKNIILNIKDKRNKDFIVTSGTAFDIEYPEYKKYIVVNSIEDKHANKASKKIVLNLTSTNYTGLIYIQSIPKAEISSGIINFFVGKNLDNSILLNIHYKDLVGNGDCYIDSDITIDTNKDGIKDDDRDFNCNELHLQKYEPKYDSIVGRIFYQSGKNNLTKDFIINFIDYQIDLEPEQKEIYNKIYDIIVNIDTSKPENEYLKSLLISLKSSLIDKTETKGIVVSIKDYTKTNKVYLTEKQQNNLDIIITRLSDESVLASEGISEYEQAKQSIIGILPYNLGTDVKKLFGEFEIVKSKDEKKEKLQEIVDTISKKVSNGDNLKEDQIDQIDMETIIMPNVCKILNFYDIPSENCKNDELKPIETGNIENIKETKTTKQGMKTRIKILLIFVLVLFIGFVSIVALFAIKAKKKAESQEEE